MADKRFEEHTEPLLYEAYMVRIWRDSPHSSWRASAQLVTNGETINFGNLPALFEFMMLRSERPASIR